MQDPELWSAIGIWIGICAAIWQIMHSRKVTGRKATLDYIARYEVHNPEWSQLSSTARSILRDESKWLPLVNDDDDPPPTTIQIIKYINHHELIAIAIEEKIVDERLYSKWARKRYLRNWNTAKPFIKKWQTELKRPRAFIRFAALADRWQQEDANADRRSSPSVREGEEPSARATA